MKPLQNMLNFLQMQYKYLIENKEHLVIDADTHISDLGKISLEEATLLRTENYYHGRPISCEQLIMDMDIAGVDIALAWQNPATTVYTDDASFNYDSLLAANEYVVRSARKNPNRIIPAGWTDPKALGVKKAIELAEHCVNNFGMGIVKLNPAQNQFPINSPDVIALVDAIVAAGATVAFHYGADTPYTPAKGLEEIAERYPDIPLIAVHMGGGGASFEDAEALYQESRKLGLRRPNLFFVESAKRDTHIESDFVTYQAAGSPYKEHLLCGSDAPYGNQVFQFGGYRALLNGFLSASNHRDRRVRDNPELFDKASIQGYLGGNFAQLMVFVYDRLLDHRGAV